MTISPFENILFLPISCFLSPFNQNLHFDSITFPFLEMSKNGSQKHGVPGLWLVSLGISEVLWHAPVIPSHCQVVSHGVAIPQFDYQLIC